VPPVSLRGDQRRALLTNESHVATQGLARTSRREHCDDRPRLHGTTLPVELNAFLRQQIEVIPVFVLREDLLAPLPRGITWVAPSAKCPRGLPVMVGI